MMPQPIARPLFLEQDERRVHGIGMVGDQASFMYPYMPPPGPSESVELRRELERIMEENQKLRTRIETLENRRIDDDQKFSAPGDPKEDAVNPHSKEAAGSHSKEAVLKGGCRFTVKGCCKRPFKGGCRSPFQGGCRPPFQGGCRPLLQAGRETTKDRSSGSTKFQN